MCFKWFLLLLSSSGHQSHLYSCPSDVYTQPEHQSLTPNLLFSTLSSLSLSSHGRWSTPCNYLCGLAVDLLLFLLPFSYRGAQRNAALHVSHQGCVKWQGPPPLNLLAVLCLMQPRVPMAVFATRVHRWLLYSFVSTRMTRSLSAKMLSSWLVLEYMGLVQSWCRTCYFPFLNSMRFL